MKITQLSGVAWKQDGYIFQITGGYFQRKELN